MCANQQAPARPAPMPIGIWTPMAKLPAHCTECVEPQKPLFAKSHLCLRQIGPLAVFISPHGQSALPFPSLWGWQTQCPVLRRARPQAVGVWPSVSSAPPPPLLPHIRTHTSERCISRVTGACRHCASTAISAAAQDPSASVPCVLHALPSGSMRLCLCFRLNCNHMSSVYGTVVAVNRCTRDWHVVASSFTSFIHRAAEFINAKLATITPVWKRICSCATLQCSALHDHSLGLKGPRFAFHCLAVSRTLTVLFTWHSRPVPEVNGD